MEEFGKRVEKFRQHIHERDRADCQVLNLSPILTLHECICGLVGIKSDVGDFILGKTHYWKIRRIADSHHDAGTLKCIQTGALTFWPGQHHANDFMAWAKSIGIEPPEEWQPISKLEDSDNDWKPKKGCNKKDIERFHCVVNAGISLTKFFILIKNQNRELKSRSNIATTTAMLKTYLCQIHDLAS